MSWNKEDYKKAGSFYINKVTPHKYTGFGDLIFNTLRMIIETNDKSYWARYAFRLCYRLLTEGKRWPDWYEAEITRTKKWMQLPIVKRIYFPGLFARTGEYRSQYSMTRDPWVMLYACAIHLEEKYYIKHKPQWWMYRPTLWSLRRALLDKRNNFMFWFNLTPSNKEYVQDLHKYMKQAYDTERCD